ncbi:hypothetical protein ATY37_20630 [Vibrio cidicii]|uniref:Glycine zipper domain-containing protein n=1 Tax=Vibrio cidicii TaxID=1763883 RepID=A0A151KU49_9VIBR|nr:hypothetical protein [Vibrio cidicii]KYN82639.1 hypothetical protein ATY37_20630 [Vibrio cidicii]
MTTKSKTIGSVENPTNERKEVSVSTAILILGSAAVGTYIGVQLGGPFGAAVGALVGAFIGTLAAGMIKNFKVKINPSGDVEVQYDTRFA